MTTTTTSDGTTTIEAPSDLPVIRMTREFAATPAQLVRAHTEKELFAKWVISSDAPMSIDYWDARTGGSWRWSSVQDGEEYAFSGCFHTVRDDRLVQTFSYEGIPDSVCLETMWFEELGEGRTRLHHRSVFESFEERDGMIASGMDSGVNDGYARLDAMLGAGEV
jgi:uncharacterized protein YndB with AHSA1/START domain